MGAALYVHSMPDAMEVVTVPMEPTLMPETRVTERPLGKKPDSERVLRDPLRL